MGGFECKKDFLKKRSNPLQNGGTCGENQNDDIWIQNVQINVGFSIIFRHTPANPTGERRPHTEFLATGGLFILQAWNKT